MPALPRRRPWLAAALVVVGVVGLGTASAAQLSVGGGSLGAGSAAVTSCQPTGQPVRVSFVNDFSGGQYRITGVRLSNVAAACLTRDVAIRLIGPGGPVGAEVTGTLSASAQTFPTAAPVVASTVTSVALVIHD